MLAVPRDFHPYSACGGTKRSGGVTLTWLSRGRFARATPSYFIVRPEQNQASGHRNSRWPDGVSSAGEAWRVCIRVARRIVPARGTGGTHPFPMESALMRRSTRRVAATGAVWLILCLGGYRPSIGQEGGPKATIAGLPTARAQSSRQRPYCRPRSSQPCRRRATTRRTACCSRWPRSRPTATIAPISVMSAPWLNGWRAIATPLAPCCRPCYATPRRPDGRPRFVTSWPASSWRPATWPPPRS